MPISDSELMAITIPSEADHSRSEATLGSSYDAKVIGMSQLNLLLSGGEGAAFEPPFPASDNYN